MQMHFTRLGRKRDHRALPEGVSATDLAIGQLFGMAKSASIVFEVVEGHLVLLPTDADQRLWAAIKACLDDIGVEAIADYFKRNNSEQRAALSASA